MLNTNFLPHALAELDFSPEMRDLFASRLNAQFSSYVAYLLNPSAVAIDDFSLDWDSLKFYAFPPFSVIPVVLKKIKATGLCVLPQWPRKHGSLWRCK